MSTMYRLASSSADYKKAHAFLSEEDAKPKRLSFPTILAEREGELVGVLGTWPSDQAVVAGPIAVRPLNGGNPSFLLLHLAEAYENILRAAGVKFYLTSSRSDNTTFLTTLEEIGFERYAEENDVVWLRRELDDTGYRRTGS